MPSGIWLHPLAGLSFTLPASPPGKKGESLYSGLTQNLPGVASGGPCRSHVLFVATTVDIISGGCEESDSESISHSAASDSLRPHQL